MSHGLPCCLSEPVELPAHDSGGALPSPYRLNAVGAGPACQAVSASQEPEPRVVMWLRSLVTSGLSCAFHSLLCPRYKGNQGLSPGVADKAVLLLGVGGTRTETMMSQSWLFTNTSLIKGPKGSCDNCPRHQGPMARDDIPGGVASHPLLD